MLTNIEIIDFALQQAQLDTGFRAQAYTWLNHILNTRADRTDMLSYRKSLDTPFTAGTRSYPYPDDFLRANAMFLVDNQGNVGAEILILDPYRFDAVNTGAQTGYPSVCMIDTNTGLINFNQTAPSSADKLWRFKYYKKAPTYTFTTDDAVVPDYEDQDTLLQELIAMAMEFTDDERQDKAKMKAKMTRQDYERNMYQSDLTSQVDLNRNVFRPRSNVLRRTYRGGF